MANDHPPSINMETKPTDSQHQCKQAVTYLLGVRDRNKNGFKGNISGMTRSMKEAGFRVDSGIIKNLSDDNVTRHGMTCSKLIAAEKHFRSKYNEPLANAQPNPGEWYTKFVHEARDTLRLNKPFQAAEFKRILLSALTTDPSNLPKNSTILSPTGQWAKPIVRKLMRGYRSTVEVYVQDPHTVAPLPDGAPDTRAILNIVQPVFNLPEALGLLSAGEESRFELFLYSPTDTVKPHAILDDDLLAVGTLQEQDCPINVKEHFGFPGLEHKILGEPQILCCIYNSIDFVSKLNAAKEYINDLRISSDPLIEWSQSVGFTYPNHDLNTIKDVFDPVRLIRATDVGKSSS